MTILKLSLGPGSNPRKITSISGQCTSCRASAEDLSSPNLSSKISPNLLLRIGVRLLLLGGPRAWLSDQRVRARFEDPIRVDNASFLVLFLLAFAGYFIIVCLFVQEKASGFFPGINPRERIVLVYVSISGSLPNDEHQNSTQNVAILSEKLGPASHACAPSTEL